MRNRRVEADTEVLADTWFHYDQVGSVLSESDASGNLSATHYQDAFGVRQADWQTGLPGGTLEGWAHNTKELDPGTGLMYMYQQHYIPEYGMFMSRAPYEVMMEHEYTFAGGNPASLVDPDGRAVVWNPLTWGDDWVGAGHFFTGGRGAGAEFANGVGHGLVDPTAAYVMPDATGATPPPYQHIVPSFVPYVLSGESCGQNADRNTKWFQEVLGPDYFVQAIFIPVNPPYIEGVSLGHYVTTITTPSGKTFTYDQYITTIPFFGGF